MFAGVHRLRQMGILTDAPAPPREEWIRGVLEYSRATAVASRSGRSQQRRLILRHAMANPDMGVLLELYRPEVADVRDECLRLRGLEPVQMGNGAVGAMLQEWLVDLAAGQRQAGSAPGAILGPHSR